MSNKIVWGNPFTHEEHSRISYSTHDLALSNNCAWCGGRNGHGGLFQYEGFEEFFCCKSCFITYHHR